MRKKEVGGDEKLIFLFIWPKGLIALSSAMSNYKLDQDLSIVHSTQSLIMNNWGQHDVVWGQYSNSFTSTFWNGQHSFSFDALQYILIPTCTYIYVHLS